MDLDAKVALITGAAHGIGAAIAKRFTTGGAHVAICDVDLDGANALAGALNAQGCSASAHAFALDVTCAADWARVIGHLGDIYGGVDILVNNAGIYQRQPLEAIEEADWDRVMAVNAKGPYLGAKGVMPTMRARGGGAIVNISSTAGIRASVATHYGASKGAVRLMTKSIALLGAKDGVRCNSVHPGPVETEMGYAALPEEVREERLGRVPLGRFAAPHEIANVVAFLASDGASFMTGAEVIVDGGATIA